MKVTIYYRAYNSFGGAREAHAAALFLDQEFSFEGNTEIEFTFCFPQDKPRRNLIDLHEKFQQQYLPTLPLISRPRKNRFAIEIAPFYNWDSRAKVPVVQPERVILVLDCLVTATEALKADPILKKLPIGYFKALQNAAVKTRENLPKDPNVFAQEFDRLSESFRVAASPRSEWDKLDIDWDQVPPEARRILDKPFFWSTTDDFGPVGNDTGADALGIYRDWRASNPKSDSEDAWPILKERLFVDPERAYDETASWNNDALAIGAAFATIIVDGILPATYRARARTSIQRLLSSSAEQEERQEKLKLMMHILE